MVFIIIHLTAWALSLLSITADAGDDDMGFMALTTSYSALTYSGDK
jgi:hypothetical protein